VKKGEGEACDVSTWTLSLICRCFHVPVWLLLVTLSLMATWCLLVVCEKRRGWGAGVTLHTWTNVDSDDDLCHHRLDDVHAMSSPSAVVLHPLGW